MQTIVRFFALVILCMSLSSCGGNNFDTINGTWVCDLEKTLRSSSKTQGLSPEIANQIQARYGAIRLVVDTNKGTMALNLGAHTINGQFHVLQDKGDTLVLGVDGASVTIVFHDKNSISIPGHDGDIFFTRTP